ncbi:hypothetical protein BX666DRAFT_1859022 [Dichotomocladium elegans]|nr:hypothetical protein BX666DRAFT_1859022 [Dichotomocladium elegans]
MFTNNFSAKKTLGRWPDKSHRRRQLKEAKCDYQARIEQYYEQLTVGCRRSHCTNRFCVSGGVGVRNLPHHAALVMAMQLAAQPENRLCILDAEAALAANEDDDNDDEGKRAHTQQPFLQCLFSSSKFLSLFGVHDKDLEPKMRRKKRSQLSSTSQNGSLSISRIATMLTYFFRCTWIQQQQQNQQSSWEIEDDDSSYYYQLDLSDQSRSSDSYESDTSDDSMRLAIRPATVDLSSGLEYLDKLTTMESADRAKHWCRSIFQSWEGIGNSMLSASPQHIPALQQNAYSINLSDLAMFYAALPRQLFETVSDSLETLLDRMLLNADNISALASIEDIDEHSLQTILEWCRAALCVIEWVSFWRECRQSSDSAAAAASANLWSDILSHKFIQVVNKIAVNERSLIRQVLISMLSSLEADRMRGLVRYLHEYLIDHFHTGPYKHGDQDSIIMAAKFLQLAYEASTMPPSGPIIPLSDFNCEAICKKLNIKDEYRIWKRVLQYGEGRHSISTIASSPSRSSSTEPHYGQNEQHRRTRLFLTTTWTSTLLPYPFANEYQFSWFNYPFLLPPPIKRKILQLDAMSQMSAEYEDSCVNHTLVAHARRLLPDKPNMVRHLETSLKSATCPYLLLEIRREHFVADTFHEVSSKWCDIKKPLKVRFVGGGEEGMDQGGVQKEFFGVLFEKLTSAEMGLFDVDPETRLCWIRGMATLDDDDDDDAKQSLRMYELVGVMIGLAIYNGVIVNLQFPSILWKLLVQPSERVIDELAAKHKLFTYHDLEKDWPVLAKGLQQLLDWPDEVQDVFCRNYEISLDVFGEGVTTVPLIEGGCDIPITNANREAFVRDYITYFLYYAQRKQLLGIRRGVWSVIGSPAMDLCTADVLEVVACGEQQGIELDLTELQSVTYYDDGYSSQHIVIRWFWSIVHGMTCEQKRKLLLFVTASDRVPVGGLKELMFVVQRNGPDSDRLPTALTCFSRLLLPEYESLEKLRERLITAIENSKGFGLV